MAGMEASAGSGLAAGRACRSARRAGGAGERRGGGGRGRHSSPASTKGRGALLRPSRRSRMCSAEKGLRRNSVTPASRAAAIMRASGAEAIMMMGVSRLGCVPDLAQVADHAEAVAAAQLLVDQDQAVGVAGQFGSGMRQVDRRLDGADAEAVQHDGDEGRHMGGRVGDEREIFVELSVMRYFEGCRHFALAA